MSLLEHDFLEHKKRKSGSNPDRKRQVGSALQAEIAVHARTNIPEFDLFLRYVKYQHDVAARMLEDLKAAQVASHELTHEGLLMERFNLRMAEHDVEVYAQVLALPQRILEDAEAIRSEMEPPPAA